MELIILKTDEEKHSEIVMKIFGMIAEPISNYDYGPWKVHVPYTYWSWLLKKSSNGLMAKDRLLNAIDLTGKPMFVDIIMDNCNDIYLESLQDPELTKRMRDDMEDD